MAKPRPVRGAGLEHPGYTITARARRFSGGDHAPQFSDDDYVKSLNRMVTRANSGCEDYQDMSSSEVVARIQSWADRWGLKGRVEVFYGRDESFGMLFDGQPYRQGEEDPEKRGIAESKIAFLYEFWRHQQIQAESHAQRS